MLLHGQANHAMPRETILRKLMGMCFSCGTRAGDHGSARVLSPPKTSATDNNQVRRRYAVRTSYAKFTNILPVVRRVL